MMRIATKISLRVAFAVVLIGVLPSIAGAADKSEVLEESALLGGPVSLIEGIRIAESRTHGKAFFANVDVDNGRPRILVETNGGQGVQTVFVDAGTGNVLQTISGGRPE